LRNALAELGPVFGDFGRYLSSRADLLPRRDCLDLFGAEPGDLCARDSRQGLDLAALVQERLAGARESIHRIDPRPRRVTRWTQRHRAWLTSSVPVEVTIVRPDADLLLGTDLPLLALLSPWLDMPADAVTEAIEDFSQTLRRRLDQVQQAAALTRLAEDARLGGALDAPLCYREHCTLRILTTERIAGVSLVEADDAETAAHKLASAWWRQATSGRMVPYDFDLRDVYVRDDRLVLAGGVLEAQAASERERFVRYLVSAVADDPDAAWDWITEATVPGAAAESAPRLRSRLRQAVPFRDGEWSGEDRLAERLLVQWRAVHDAGWKMRSHQLHLYRGIQAVSAATEALVPEGDVLLDALRNERLRLGLAGVQRLADPGRLADARERLLRDMVELPQKLNEFLTLAGEGRVRVELRRPDARSDPRARNSTVSLVASLVSLAGVAYLTRHLAPALGPDVERIGTVLVLIIGGWLLTAAARP